MKTKLIMVEGLPGFGKSTTSRMIYDILTERNIEARLVLEGDVDHPADYEGTACVTEEEFGQLLQAAGAFNIDRASRQKRQLEALALPEAKERIRYLLSG